MKQNKRVRARQNKKAHQAMQKSKNNRVDNVDRLVDKLYQSKNKNDGKKSKLYD